MTERLDDLLGRANVLTEARAAAFESPDGFDELFANIVADDTAAAGTPRATKRRSTRRTIAALGVAATLVVGGATAAAARWTSVHTGSFGHAGDTENDASEFLDLGADDMPRVAAELGAHIPYPPGDDVHAYIPGLVGTGGLMQASGIKAYLSTDAVCAWWGYWLQSDREGNSVERARATTVLEQAPTWPVVVATDGGGVVTQYEQIAAAARNGAPGVIQQAYTANCLSLPRRWEHR